MSKLTLKEQMTWGLSLFWGVAFALFTIWFYFPFCLKKIRTNDRVAFFYKISLGASMVFFIYQCFVCCFIMWMLCNSETNNSPNDGFGCDEMSTSATMLFAPSQNNEILDHNDTTPQRHKITDNNDTF